MNVDIFENAYTLLTEKKYTELKNILTELLPADIYEFFDMLTEEQYALVFRLLPKSLAAEVFVEMDAELQEKLIEVFNNTELAAITSELFLDDTVDIIEEMPANAVKRILASVSPERRRTINELMNYPEDSAGALMTTEFVRFKQNMTVRQAFEQLHTVAITKETVYTCYITDAKNVLIGVVTVRDMIISEPETNIADIMETNVISVNTKESSAEVTALLKKYSFLALPVVDSDGRLVGIITFDDVLETAIEEAEEDFAIMSGVTPTDKPYLKTSVLQIVKSRVLWLLLMMVSATFTGIIISSFEESLAAVAVLTVFIPMLMGTGGNSGSQASVTVIRGISLNEIEFRDTLKVMLKEMTVGILCGAILAVATFFKVLLIDGKFFNDGITVSIAAVISITMFATVLISKLVGCSLPLIAKRLGFDPAVMASPFITTIVDAVALILYFSVAKAIIL